MQTSDLTQYLAIFRKRLWMILLLFAVTMTVILVQALTAKPIYSAAVRLQIIPMESEQVALYSQSSGASTTDLTAYLFIQEVRGGTTAWRTIGQLGLKTDAEQLIGQLTATQDKDFVTVVAQAESPQDAADIVTTQVDNALTAFRADRARPAVVTGEFIVQQLTESEQTLAAARTELQRFKLSHSLDSLEREIVSYQDIIRNLRRDKEGAILTAVQLAARVRGLGDEATQADALAAAAKPESEAQTAATRRGNDLRGAIASLAGDLSGQQALQAEYDHAIARWETDLTSLIGLNEEYTRLGNAVTQAQNTRDFLFNKALEARLKQQQATSIGYLKLVEPARRPDQPLPRRTLQIALVGGFLSLVAGTVLALIFEFIASLTGANRTRSRQA
ncbi:MAG: hypothetical protein NT169_17600 [Chloroflexi bacterium]|nr:hypothetical protein [Chloroflexota bacterium]